MLGVLWFLLVLSWRRSRPDAEVNMRQGLTPYVHDTLWQTVSPAGPEEAVAGVCEQAAIRQASDDAAGAAVWGKAARTFVTDSTWQSQLEGAVHRDGWCVGVSGDRCCAGVEGSLQAGRGAVVHVALRCGGTGGVNGAMEVPPCSSGKPCKECEMLEYNIPVSGSHRHQ